jgi:peptidoglycan/LPS O-acetylase OafA/YrhL
VSEATPATWRLGHRPELDGLRGVAIALVVIFHLDPNAMPGGKVGVDLFFVLSGFLITSLLLAEFESSDRINLPGFYARRARRLLPALAVLLLVVGVVLAAQRSWADVASLGYVAGYVGNYAWEAGHLAGPVQHCWSLAIEEQFYILWPLGLLLLLKLKSRRAVFIAILVLIAALLVHRLAGNSPSQSDLTTDMRADELVVGGLFACGFAWYGWARVRWWMWALVALPLIALDVVDNLDLRGYGFTVVAFAFAAMLGAALTCAPLGEMLSFAPLRFLGVISYSLYLWHYPVIYWVRGGTSAGIFNATLLNSLIAVAIALPLAIASHFLIENRFRRPAAPILDEAGVTR